MYFIVEDVTFHMVNIMFEYSFKKRRYGVLKMSRIMEPSTFDGILS